MTDEFVTIGEAAAVLRVSKRKMFQLLSAGIFERVYPPGTKCPRLLRSMVEGVIAKERDRVNRKMGR
jgi:hypothetical protein